MKKTQNRLKIIRLINVFAFATATVVATAISTLYFYEVFARETHEVKVLASLHASAITKGVIENPDAWPSQQDAILALMTNAMYGDEAASRSKYSILDVNRELVVSSASEVLPGPTIVYEERLYDEILPIGYYRMERSLQVLLFQTLLVAMGAMLLALMIVFPLRAVPLRALQRAFNDLEEEKEKALVTLESIGDAVITTDDEMLIEYLNPVAERLTGWTTAQARGLHMDQVFNIFSEITRARVVNPIKQCLDTNSIVEMSSHTILVRKTDGKEFHIENSAAPIKKLDSKVIGAVMVFHDVTERKIDQTRLHHIAYHDALTELPNRAYFQKKLMWSMQNAQQHCKHVAVLFMDLDRFKIINDSLGHAIGDELLIQVAKRLKQCMSDGDTVSRMGGDEFSAVLNGLTSTVSVEIVANKILHALTNPFVVQGQQLRISASIGISIFPQDGSDVNTLLKNADTAMYQAKSLGKNNYQHYSASMGVTATSSLNLETALHSALENNEYFLEYQPQLRLKDNQIIGAEALLRWQTPKLGRVMPSDFISRLEETGEIIPVGTWVLKAAIKQARTWMDAGHPLVVSVNVSVMQLTQFDLVGRISAMLETAGLPPHLLQVEITESILINDVSRSEKIISELKAIGVGVSLDDFGTGYSSLSYLGRFPISELKIDRSFILNVGKNIAASTVIKAVIELGKALNMSVVAEGVETEEQFAALDAMGCDAVQGYLISKPLSVANLEQFLMSQNLELL